MHNGASGTGEQGAGMYIQCAGDCKVEAELDGRPNRTWEPYGWDGMAFGVDSCRFCDGAVTGASEQEAEDYAGWQYDRAHP